MPAPELVVLDVNEALSDLEALRERFMHARQRSCIGHGLRAPTPADDRGMRSLRSCNSDPTKER